MSVIKIQSRELDSLLEENQKLKQIRQCYALISAITGCEIVEQREDFGASHRIRVVMNGRLFEKMISNWEIDTAKAYEKFSAEAREFFSHPESRSASCDRIHAPEDIDRLVDYAFSYGGFRAGTTGVTTTKVSGSATCPNCGTNGYIEPWGKLWICRHPFDRHTPDGGREQYRCGCVFAVEP